MGSPVLLKRGAEAELVASEYLGRPTVEKRRVVKRYRHGSLDASLRASRLRTEARLMSEARRVGVAVPVMYDIDPEGNRLILERLDGPTAKEVLDRGGPPARAVCRAIGRAAAALHRADIVHGDLTTSNAILSGGRVHLIDFSLGEKTSSIEAKGVDIHLLREALTSAHRDAEAYYTLVVSAYRRGYPRAAEVLAKVREIEERGRYT